MSVLEFITSGGMASIEGDLSDDEREIVNSTIKQFAEKVGKVARSIQVPVSLLKVRQSTFLFVGKNLSGYHIVFADAPGDNKLIYRDLTIHGRIDLQAIVHQVRIEIGDVIWAFTIPQRIPEDELSNYLDNIVAQYVNSVIQSQHTPEKKVSEEAIIAPEIASGVEKFKRDFPSGTKTAFIIMQFEDTKPHKEIVTTIKDTLKNTISLLYDLMIKSIWMIYFQTQKYICTLAILELLSLTVLQKMILIQMYHLKLDICWEWEKMFYC